MLANHSRQPARSFFVIGLLLIMLVLVRSADAQQQMIEYPDWPVYGLSSGISATADIYLPENAGELLSDPALRALDVVNLPAVLFIPALSASVMNQYASDLTGHGYAVVALDYRLQSAAQDGLCGLAWLHTFAPVFGIDENRIVTFGYGKGGELAALLGSMNSMTIPVTGGPSAGPLGMMTETSVGMPEDCPWPVPEDPMIEGVVTYDALLDTPVILTSPMLQLTKLPPHGMSRAEMIAAFDELAAMPAVDWHEYRPPETALVEVPLADVLRERISQPETTAQAEVPVAEVLREQFVPPVAVQPIDLTYEQLTSLAQTLPAYWLDGSEPVHMLMVGEESNPEIRADNLAYNNLLRNLGVTTHWVEMGGCGHDQCALIGNLEPMDMFLADVFASS